MASEKSGLVSRSSDVVASDVTTYTELPLSQADSKNSSREQLVQTSDSQQVKLRRNISLIHAIGIIVGTVIGSGIFITSKTVTENVGSVGASLVVWAVTGVYVFLQSWCYAELATVLPLAGGDYSYNYVIGGPLPAFVIGWIHVVINVPTACGASSQTAGLYVAKVAGLEDNRTVKTLIAVTILMLLVVINARSVKLAARLNTALTAAKVMALTFIIVTGLVLLASGRTSNFEDAFAQTETSAGRVSLAVLSSYYAYKAWEHIAALPEEMTNPKRDLPLALVLALSLITAVYVLTNVAYFTALTVPQVLASDAVALTFMESVLGRWASAFISVCVALSCFGTINGHYLTDSRYIFAAGRNEQLPSFLSMINIHYYTPMPSLMLLCLLYTLFALTPDLTLLLEFSSTAVQVKVVFTIVCLLVYKWQKPDIERPVCMPWWLAVLVLLAQLGLLGLSFYTSPVVLGLALGLCALALPAYGILCLVNTYNYQPKALGVFTHVVQKILLVTKESDTSK